MRCLARTVEGEGTFRPQCKSGTRLGFNTRIRCKLRNVKRLACPNRLPGVRHLPLNTPHLRLWNSYARRIFPISAVPQLKRRRQWAEKASSRWPQKPNESHNTRMRNVKPNIKRTSPRISAEGRCLPLNSALLGTHCRRGRCRQFAGGWSSQPKCPEG